MLSLHCITAEITSYITDLVQTCSHIFQEMSVTTGQWLQDMEIRHLDEAYMKLVFSTALEVCKDTTIKMLPRGYRRSSFKMGYLILYEQTL